MTEMDTEQIRQALSGEQERLQTMQADIRRDADLQLDESTPGGGETSAAVPIPGDPASEQLQREVNLSMLEQIEAELSDIERAAQKLDEGTYGTCEACSKPIAPERLVALPMTRFCVEDQAQAETEVTQLSPAEKRGATDTASPI